MTRHPVTQQPATGPRRGPTISGRVATAIVVIGIVGISALVGYIVWVSRADKKMDAPPIGAGAGRTGMHNEYGGLGR